MKEEWKSVKGFDGLYEISNCGRLKSLARVTRLNGHTRTEPEKIMACTMRSGYKTVVLRKNGKRYSRQIHRLVAEAFIPNPYNLPIVNHKDFCRVNNRAENLEWCTSRDNALWSADNMRRPKSISKTTNTGEKYIYLTKYGTYRVAVGSGNFRRTKSFSNIEEAIRYRNAEEKRVNSAR